MKSASPVVKRRRDMYAALALNPMAFILSHPPVLLHDPNLHLNIISVLSFNFHQILQGILYV